MSCFKALRHRKVRASAQSSLEAAASAPNSGFAFVDNSEGASAAVAELSGVLDLAVEQLDLEGKKRWRGLPFDVQWSL
jgi:hypothetical protein